MFERKRPPAALAVVLSALFFVSGPASAQERPAGGELVYAEGGEFAVVRDGVVTRFVPSDDAYAGFALLEGDLLQTGAKTFVEVQLRPKGTMLKVAENSSFLFQRFGAADGRTALSLLYGRVRAKVAKVSGGESFSIRSRQTVAGVRGTDFGFDSIVSPGAAASLAVYAFSGEVAVLPNEAASPGAELPVRAGELVAVTESAAAPLTERRSVDAGVRAFWSAHDFKGKPPLPAPEGALLSEAAPQAPAPAAAPAAPADRKARETELRNAAADFRPYLKVIRAKNASAAASLAFTVAAFALQAAGAYLYSAGDSGTGSILVWSGGAVGGVSLITLVSALLIPEPAP